VEIAFQKYIFVVVLFVIFVALANLWHYRESKDKGIRLRYRQRRARARAQRELAKTGLESGLDGLPSPGAQDREPPQEDSGADRATSFMWRFSPWFSLAAVAVSLIALGMLWFATELAKELASR